MSKQTISFVAGKSGGHIIPCLTLAQQYQDKHPKIKVLFFSSNTALDRKILAKHRTVNRHIPFPLTTFRVSQIYRYPFVILQVVYAFIGSFYHLWKHKPITLISTGGIIAIPVCVAAYILRIPIELYELNAVPGKTIKLLKYMAQKNFVCFAQTKKYFSNTSCSLIAYPVRYAIEDKHIRQEAARSLLSLEKNKKTLLVLGGSQGSIFLNNIIKQWLDQYPAMHTNIQLIHQTGARDPTNWSAVYKKHGIEAQVFNYQEDLAYYYIASDLVLCRAGAGTLFEIQFFNKKCIIIPLKTKTTTHQIDNAQSMAKQFPNQFHVFLPDQNIQQLFASINQILISVNVPKTENTINQPTP